MEGTRTWNLRRKPAPAWIRPCAHLALLALLALSCGGPAKGPGSGPARGEWHTFEGMGTSSGRAQTLQLGPGRSVSIIHMTGSMLLTGEQRLGQGFRTESIGFSDSMKSGKAWSVWTDSRGDRIFSELKGEAVGTGNRFEGTFLGGTGPYAGMTGEYEFEWQYVVRAEEGTIQGRSIGFRGRFRQAPFPSPSDRSPGTEGGRR